MNLKYIIEICIGIDIAIFGIAYPIIITEINKIGDKFNSNYLPDIFRLEWISREINLKYFKASRFQIVLISTITSFTFLIINAKPWFGWNNEFIDNSAELIVLFFTVLLIGSFLYWIKIVALYNGKPVKLLEHLIKKYQSFKSDPVVSKYFLRGINDFAYYTIKNQDTHLQVALLDFYWDEFDNHRKKYSNKIDILKIEKEKNKELIKKHRKANEKEQNKKLQKELNIEFIKKKIKEIKEIDKELIELNNRGVEYSAELYDLIYRINIETLINNNFLIKGLERHSVSGWWLLGNDTNQTKISELTYRWLWKILNLNLDREENLKTYWSRASQYCNYAFDIYPDFIPGQYEPINSDIILQKEKEKERFLEFNYILGGLLIQQNKYEVLGYFLSYSSSSPPNYALLPNSIDDIFYWFEKFRDRSNISTEEIEIYYKFPDLDNYGVSYKIKYWICSYICLLYIRQFSLHQYFTYQNHIGTPNLPDEKQDLNKILKGIPFFKSCLNDVISNNELLRKVGLDKKAINKREEIEKHLLEVEEAIIKKLGITKELKELSPTKIKQFEESTVEIIKKGKEEYSNILQDYNQDIIYEKSPKLVINGGVNIMQKSAFVDKDIPHLNFHETLAQSIVNNSIRKYIPSSFIVARTEKYLVPIDTLVLLIKKLLSNKSSKELFVTIGFNVDFRTKENIENAKLNVSYHYSSHTFLKNIFFVLKKSDLPSLYIRDIDKDEKSKYKLEEISSSLKMYSSVLELNKHQELKRDWLNTGYKEEDLNNDPKVQVTISFVWLLLWKPNRRIVQIKISDPSIEQGLLDNIEDVNSF